MFKYNIIEMMASGIAVTIVITHILRNKAKKSTYKVINMNSIPIRKKGFYEKYVKRVLDVVCAGSAIILFSPLYIVIALLVKFKLGSPILFEQERPGLLGLDGKETIFKMYKFRTMTNIKDDDGNLLPDDVRLTKFGAWLRSTSLDELPEAFNILNGTMSVIGPRPQLVRDMIFMSDKQRMRHTAKPGLSGLAQVNGRNAITWDDKLEWDLKYLDKINFVGDIKIIFDTVKKAFIRKEGIIQENMVTAEDFGDYLLRTKQIDDNLYTKKQQLASQILNKSKELKESEEELQMIKDKAVSKKYSVLMSLYKKENPEYLKIALDSMINQTVKPDEIILVEDGLLTDELYAVLDEYNQYLHRIKNETNLGLGLALNVGLKICKNELVARMDTDDCSKPDRCEKQMKRFEEKPNLSIVGSHIDEFVDNISNVVSKRKVPTTSEAIYNYAKRRSAFNHPTIMYRKSKVLKQGGYADLKRNQDVDLFGRMLYAGDMAENIDESLLWFRSSDKHAKRRKSWQNTSSYIATIYNFWKMGYSSFFDFTLVGIAQTVMCLMPIKVQNLLYKKILRN